MKAGDSIIVTRPDYDMVTKYISAWTQGVVDMAEAKGLKVADLKGSKATRANLESYANRHAPVFIFLNGHGNAEVVTGHNNESLLDSESNVCTDIIYARSCEAAQILGPRLVARSVKFFIGYTRKFIFSYDIEKVHNPLEDHVAGLFLAPSNLVATTIIKGHSVGEANSRSKEAMYRNFKIMIASTSTFEERFLARWLWSNIQSQVVLGSKPY